MMILMLLTACALLYGTSRLFTQKALVLAMARSPQSRVTRPRFRWSFEI